MACQVRFTNQLWAALYLQSFHPTEQAGVSNRIFKALAARGGRSDQRMIDATNLEKHRTAASLLEKGIFTTLARSALRSSSAFSRSS
jgi:hypothetical protein